MGGAERRGFGKDGVVNKLERSSYSSLRCLQRIFNEIVAGSGQGLLVKKPK